MCQCGCVVISCAVCMWSCASVCSVHVIEVIGCAECVVPVRAGWWRVIQNCEGGAVMVASMTARIEAAILQHEPMA